VSAIGTRIVISHTTNPAVSMINSGANSSLTNALLVLLSNRDRCPGDKGASSKDVLNLTRLLGDGEDVLLGEIGGASLSAVSIFNSPTVLDRFCEAVRLLGEIGGA